jgi:predicted nuclease of restriction endonuclease-like RecB superfamily
MIISQNEYSRLPNYHIRKILQVSEMTKTKKQFPKLSVFQTFKTKDKEFTGEAMRQRGIIIHLAAETLPTRKTRTAIAHKLAEQNGTTWQNIYSGIFRDLDEILLPLELVQEAGRLPIKRGPKALQEQGVPYYQLTDSGVLVAASVSATDKERTLIMNNFLEKDSNTKEKDLKKAITTLLDVAPNFVSLILRRYIESYSEGKIDKLVPFNSEYIKKAFDDVLNIQRELLEGFSSLSNPDREPIMSFLKKIG